MAFDKFSNMSAEESGEKSLTNLEELSFLTVLALPKASRIGLACSSCLSSSPYRIQRIMYQ